MNKLFIVISVCLFIAQSAFSQNIIFQTKFETSLQTEESEEPINSSGLTFENGLTGNAINFPSNGILQYPLNNNLEDSKGTLSIWVNPNWAPGNNILHRIAVIGDDIRHFEIHVDEGGNLAFAVNVSQVNGDPIVLAIAGVNDWLPGQWHQLVFSWDNSEIRAYSDGQLLASQTVGYDLPSISDSKFHIGSFNGEKGFDGLMDELIIYDGVRSPEDIALDFEKTIEAVAKTGNLVITDAFGRTVNEERIHLVDWEGFLRNPAYKFNISPTDEVNFPFSVTLGATHGNAYFDAPSTVDQVTGPVKTLTFNSAEDVQTFYISYFPDRDFDDENFQLQLRYFHADGLPRTQNLDIIVEDEDVEEVLTYDAVLDFSEDTTQFLAQPQVREIIEEAARDWMYFIDGSALDSIDVGDALVVIGRTGNLVDEKLVANKKKYRGLYMFVHGTNQPFDGSLDENGNPLCICSTGYSGEFFQTSQGSELPIRPIGGHELNIDGDQGTDGYSYFRGDENWDRFHRENDKQDLYELTKHEMGHVLFGAFDYPLHIEALARGYFTSPELDVYYPGGIIELRSDSPDHFAFVTDPISLGNPYGGNVRDLLPTSRELVTKTDLLIMESIGYPMRPIRALAPLLADVSNSLYGVVNKSFSTPVEFSGSIPYINFTVTAGELPAGITLDPFTGVLSGTPTESGSFPITILVEEYAVVEKNRSISTILEIAQTASTEAKIIAANTTGQIGETVINETDRLVQLTVDTTMNIANLLLSIDISPGASISPNPSSVTDYSSPVNFLITAQDEVTTAQWTIVVEQEMIVGTNEILADEFSVYPNPANGELYIVADPGTQAIESIAIYDLSGRMMSSSRTPPRHYGTYQINTTALNDGFYFLKVQTSNQTILKKFMLKR